LPENRLTFGKLSIHKRQNLLNLSAKEMMVECRNCDLMDRNKTLIKSAKTQKQKSQNA
jgi:hypothetical protein